MASPSFQFKSSQRLHIELIIMERFSTMQKFAKHIQVNPGYLSTIMNNNANAGTKTAHKISKGLELPIEKVFEIKTLVES